MTREGFRRIAAEVFQPLNTQLRGREYTQAVGDIVRAQVNAYEAGLKEAAKDIIYAVFSRLTGDCGMSGDDAREFLGACVSAHFTERREA